MPLLHPVIGLPVKLLTLTEQANAVLFTLAGGPVYPVDLRVTITSGHYLYASTTGNYGLDVGGFASGSKITITNLGYIAGKGGDGGAGGYGGNASPYNPSVGAVGNAGGPALRVQAMSGVSVFIDNTSGQINGGGGGGGGGGGCGFWDGTNGASAGGGGGGGGQCGANSAGGGAGAGANWGGVGVGSGGGTGSRAGGAAGGIGGVYSIYITDPAYGGAGAGWGSTGNTGETAQHDGVFSFGVAGGAGGAGGAAVVGNANITWIATGTRNGAIT